jgi:tripartite-type tricarboxylate transporter receptor subunit TctC
MRPKTTEETAMTPRRALLAAPALLLATAARAEAWPERPLRLVIPFVPGGTTDILGRLLAQAMTPRLGQTMVVENRGGAGGSLGAGEVAHARPDGYSLLLSTNGSLTINPLVQANLAYDPFRQLAPLGLCLTVPMLVVVRHDHPAKTVQEFVAQSKSRPGAVSMGSAGTGSSNHLAIELFNAASQAQLTHVPYRGSGPVIADLLAGNLNSMMDQITTSLPLVQEGRVRALAITDSHRSRLLPNVPTLAEAGYPDADMVTFMGLSTTAPLPAEAEARLVPAMRDALGEPIFHDRLEGVGAEIVRDQQCTPAGYAAFLRRDYDRMKRAVLLAGLKPE